MCAFFLKKKYFQEKLRKGIIMNKMFWKFGLLAASMFALSACSEDSTSNAEESTSSSSAAQIEMSSASEVSPVVMDKLGADVMSDGQGGEMVQLKGLLAWIMVSELKVEKTTKSSLTLIVCALLLVMLIMEPCMNLHYKFL
jgi:hypothetical protein